MTPDGKVGFAIGTGRCGTLFLHQAVALEPHVSSSHERNPDNEAFHRYCKWNDLPVDDEGFLHTKADEIRADLETHAYSFEASPYLSLAARELHERFGARFVLLVRRPDRVVTSFVHKGFYRRRHMVSNVDLAAGYQRPDPDRIHTFFARITPRGPAFRSWNEMTPTGKVAWFWKAWNERTLEVLDLLPQDCYRVVRIEDYDYERHVATCEFLGFRTQVLREDFDALRAARPHAFHRKRDIDAWSAQEIAEFEAQVKDLAPHFGYEWRIDRLIEQASAEKADRRPAAPPPSRKAGPQLWNLRRNTAQWLRSLAQSIDVT
ncbi:MAG TPA: hypothetical protein PL143_00270 [Rhodocyclaceae bacterium]|nr:hypothetical protein [Rhodocyclaceae bacterium]